MLEAENVTVAYSSKNVLHGLSVRFQKGVLTSVIGKNGSGKSTLLKALLGIVPIKDGLISVDGIDVSSIKRRVIAQKISYLSQSKNLPEMTVGEMVLHGRFPHLSYPRRYSANDRMLADQAMEKMGIIHLADEPMAALSGGMRQSAYLAMALAQDTEYILLDEPTSFLDVPHQIELMKILRALANEGKGIVCVMHDLALAFDFSDEIALLDGGGIVGQSSPEEFCKSSDLQRVFGVSLDRSDEGRYFYRLEI